MSRLGKESGVANPQFLVGEGAWLALYVSTPKTYRCLADGSVLMNAVDGLGECGGVVAWGEVKLPRRWNSEKHRIVRNYGVKGSRLVLGGKFGKGCGEFQGVAVFFLLSL